MTKGNSSFTEKHVTDWFDGLSFDRQVTVLRALSSAHSKVRTDRIAKLRKELAALEGNGHEKVNGVRGSAPVQAKYRNPATGEAWSGRGRMAGWLATKVKSGEKPQRYLVK